MTKLTLTPTPEKAVKVSKALSKKLGLTLIVKETFHIDINGNKITYPAIYETFNYHLFHYLKSNRPVIASHVAKMGRSIQDLQAVLRDAVIVKIGHDYFYIDAQHMCGALAIVGLPIRAKIIKVDNEKDALKYITAMNSSSKNWSLKQFVLSWSLFNKDYKMLYDFEKKFNLTMTTIASLLINNSIGKATKAIKSGNFEVIDKDNAIRIIQKIDHFYSATGLLPCQYTTTGLIDFIGSIGRDVFYQIEKKFIANVIKLNKKRIH